VVHNLPVRIIGVGGGFEYDYSGITHYTLEDIGVLRTPPNLSIFVPADDAQAKQCLQATWNTEGPVYYRLAKRDNTIVPGLDGRFDSSGVAVVREQGNDVLMLTMGILASEALAAADVLKERGVGASVAVVSRLAPPPFEALAALVRRFSMTVTVEAHYRHGGLGTLTAEAMANMHCGNRLVCCCIDSIPTGINGTESFMNDRYGLSSRRIVEKIEKEFRCVETRL
jgi:transketolase